MLRFETVQQYCAAIVQQKVSGGDFFWGELKYFFWVCLTGAGKG